MQDDEKEFTHPGLRMVHDEQGFRVLLPVKTQRYRKLLHTVWFLVWMAGEAALLASLFGWWAIATPPRIVLIPFTAAFTAAGMFVLYRLLWYWAGREKFTVSGGRLTVRRQFLGMGRTWTFKPGTVRAIRGRQLDYRVVYPSWGRPFIGHGEGEIVVDAADGTHEFAKGLEEDEAHGLAALLNQELHHHPTRDRRPSEMRAAR
jgi:hypothetical protein